MAYKDTGNIPIDECNDANIPVSCFLDRSDEPTPHWIWIADNFMPRRGRVVEGEYVIQADSKEEIMQLVAQRVIPLYEAALQNLQEHGENYYWKRNQQAEG